MICSFRLGQRSEPASHYFFRMRRVVFSKFKRVKPPVTPCRLQGHVFQSGPATAIDDPHLRKFRACSFRKDINAVARRTPWRSVSTKADELYESSLPPAVWYARRRRFKRFPASLALIFQCSTMRPFFRKVAEGLLLRHAEIDQQFKSTGPLNLQQFPITHCALLECAFHP